MEKLRPRRGSDLVTDNQRPNPDSPFVIPVRGVSPGGGLGRTVEEGDFRGERTSFRATPLWKKEAKAQRGLLTSWL